MDPKALLDQLPAAEMALAHFNALRTAAAGTEAGIRCESTGHFHLLLDAARPDSSYYSRAVARSAAALEAEALDALPPAVAAVETQPAQLSPEAADRVLARRFVPSYQLCYLGRATDADPPAGWAVTPLAATDTELLFDLLQSSGVDFPPAKRRLKQPYYCTPQFPAFVARAADGSACGWTTMHVQGQSAFFGNTYTVPAWRRQGVHAALLAARLQAAARLGLEAAYVDVEHRSQSHLNCERAGFRTLTINTIWARRANPPGRPLADTATV